MKGAGSRRGVILAGVAAAMLAGDAWAQNRDKAWEVTPEIGWIRYGAPHLGDGTTVVTSITPPRRTVSVVTSEIDDSPSYAFRFGYHWSRKQMIEFGFSGTATAGVFHNHKTVYDTTVPPLNPPVSDVKSENVSIDLIVGHANYVYNFFMHHRGKVVGFVTGGVGLVNTSIFGQTAEPDLQPILDSLVGDENAFMFNYGAGIRFFGSEKVGFRIDVRQVRYDSSSRTQQDHIEAGIALTLVLGGA
jgi:hypothetical protein